MDGGLTLPAARRLAGKLPATLEESTSTRGMTWSQMRQRIENLERICDQSGIDSGKIVRKEVIRGPSLGKRLPGSYGSASR